MKVLILIFLLVLLIYLGHKRMEGFQRGLDLYFSKDELQNFAKYKDYSKIVQIHKDRLPIVIVRL